MAVKSLLLRLSNRQSQTSFRYEREAHRLLRKDDRACGVGDVSFDVALQVDKNDTEKYQQNDREMNIMSRLGRASHLVHQRDADALCIVEGDGWIRC